MTVNIDPSEVRGNGISVKALRGTPRFWFPLRAVLIGGIGGAGLIAFSVGAFSFFSGLADPRVRTPRMMPVATQMPDLRDGVPALAPVSGAGIVARAAGPDLPRPTVATEPQPSAPAPVSAMASKEADAGEAAKTAPAIQNAPVIADAPRSATLVPPARTETVRAKTAQPSAFVSLPAEGGRPQRDPGPTAQEARKPAKPPTQKTAAQGKAVASKPAAGAALAQRQADAHPAEDDDAIPGSRQVRAGLKAIGGLFSGSESD